MSHLQASAFVQAAGCCVIQAHRDTSLPFVYICRADKSLCRRCRHAVWLLLTEASLKRC